MTNKNNYTAIGHDAQVKNAYKKSRFYSSVKEMEKEKK
jgi:hypothetical protein